MAVDTVILNLVDSSFSHNRSAGSILPDLSQQIVWDKNVKANDDIVVYTENFDNPVWGAKKIALLIEPYDLIPSVYKKVLDNINKFDLVLSHDMEFVKKHDKIKFFVYGGCWVYPHPNAIKTKNISIIASQKSSLPGHILRHHVINRFKNNIDFICGNGYLHIKNKEDALKDFRFSIIIENVKKDFWFTEKLLDCFLNKTIPIYWGCNLDTFFDTKGILSFDNLDQLSEIIKIANDDLYQNMKSHIEYNFNKAKEFMITENNILKVLQENNIV